MAGDASRSIQSTVPNVLPPIWHKNRPMPVAIMLPDSGYTRNAPQSPESTRSHAPSGEPRAVGEHLRSMDSNSHTPGLRSVPSNSNPTTPLTLEPVSNHQEQLSPAGANFATLIENPHSAASNPPRFRQLLKKVRDAFAASRRLQADDRAVEDAEKQLQGALAEYNATPQHSQFSPMNKEASETTVSKAKDMVEWRRSKLDLACTVQQNAIEELCNELSMSMEANRQLETEVTKLKEDLANFKLESARQITSQTQTTRDMQSKIDTQNQIMVTNGYRLVELDAKLKKGDTALRTLSNKFNKSTKMEGVSDQKTDRPTGASVGNTEKSFPSTGSTSPYQVSQPTLQHAENMSSPVEPKCICHGNSRSLLCKARYPLVDHGEIQNIWSWVDWLEMERKRMSDAIHRTTPELRTSHVSQSPVQATFTPEGPRQIPEVELMNMRVDHLNTQLFAMSKHLQSVEETMTQAHNDQAAQTKSRDLRVQTIEHRLQVSVTEAKKARVRHAAPHASLELWIQNIQRRLEAAAGEALEASQEHTHRIESLSRWSHHLDRRLQAAAREAQDTWRDHASWIGQRFSKIRQEYMADRAETNRRVSILCKNISPKLDEHFKSTRAKIDSLETTTVAMISWQNDFSSTMVENLEHHPVVAEFRGYMSQNPNPDAKFFSLDRTLTDFKNHMTAAEKKFIEQLHAMQQSNQELRQKFDSMIQDRSADNAAGVVRFGERQTRLAIVTEIQKLQHQYGKPLLQNDHLDLSLTQSDKPKSQNNKLTAAGKRAIATATVDCETSKSSDSSDNEEGSDEPAKTHGTSAASPLSIASDDEYSEYVPGSRGSSRSSSPSPGPHPLLAPPNKAKKDKGKRKAEPEVDDPNDSIIILGPGGVTEAGSSKAPKRIRTDDSTTPFIHAFFADNSKWTNE